MKQPVKSIARVLWHLWDAVGAIDLVTKEKNRRIDYCLVSFKLALLLVDGDGRPVIEKLGARQYSPTPGTLTMAVYKYQVWSSVLGQAVATMDPSGNQIENRIYAGSTLIATARGRSTTGTSADDAIDFHVKEPVTNTTVTYAYNATTSNWATAEQEPFGQNISSIDPYIEEWNNYAQVLNGAQDPEWQCAMYDKFKDGFSQMPIHCQKAAMQKAYFGYDNKFWNGKSNDLTNLATAGTHSASDNLSPASTDEAPSKAVAAAASTATNKAEKGGPSAADGEHSFTCDPDDPECQIANVESGPYQDDPLDEFNAENAGRNLGAEALSSCVKKLFTPYFQDYLVNGKGVRIVSDARFIRGGHVPAGKAAMTLGLYNINYDPEFLDVDSPNWNHLFTIAEELAHAEQFVSMWQNLGPVPYTVPNPNNPRFPITKTRAATYTDASSTWAIRYLVSAGGAVVGGRESYDNQVEREAQSRAREIIDNIRTKYPTQSDNNQKICP